MAPESRTVAKMSSTSNSPYQLDTAQTLRATNALLTKLRSEESSRKALTPTNKTNLLAEADDEDINDETPVWLILTTKKHIVDKKRLKPGKILLPHPYLSPTGPAPGADDPAAGLRICLITADPQRKYKDLLAHPTFPVELAAKVQRVLGMEKLKSKFKSYEEKRRLLGEFDVFLADDRVITYLPQVLGKPFYKGGSKRPIPVSLEGKREGAVDAEGNKRKKLSEGGTKVTKAEVDPKAVAREIERALSSALVHLAPSATTAVKVGVASQSPENVGENVQAVVDGLVERYVTSKWRGVRAVHIKGPETAALPIWVTEQLWEDEQDVLDTKPVEGNPGSKKRKRGALAEAPERPAVIEVPGPDGKMRLLERPEGKASKRKGEDAAADGEKKTKKRKSGDDVPVDLEAAKAKAAEKLEKEARKEALKKQKDSLRADGDAAAKTKSKKKVKVAA
ncbi:hypothetical protein MBLNU230_g5042t1 [Neophaeotheca triangularis]